MIRSPFREIAFCLQGLENSRPDVVFVETGLMVVDDFVPSYDDVLRQVPLVVVNPSIVVEGPYVPVVIGANGRVSPYVLAQP